MNKKVIIISASPRKGGNSDLLCDQFLKGAIEAGHQAQKIFLCHKNIGYCTGCGICNKTHKCIINDDMADILQKMIDADVIVMATPVYFYSMDGQMKTFIDRCVPRYQEISNKDFYFIIAAADNDKKMMERTLEGFRGFTQDCLENATEKGIIYGTGAWQMGDIKENIAMQEAYKMAKSI